MRLEITRKADLATRALLELDRRAGTADPPPRAKAADLARSVGTTAGFLTQVMSPLLARGWVRSEPGPTGGYVVVADLADLSVLQVIEAVEGPTDTGRCVLEERTCAGGGTCALHVPWSRARGQLTAEMSRTSLASLTGAA
jgi:Rrf2 family protein